MECSHAKSLLSEYLDDSLAPQDREAVSEHLQACTECRGELAALASLVHELGALDSVDPPRDFLLQLHDRQGTLFFRRMNTGANALGRSPERKACSTSVRTAT